MAEPIRKMPADWEMEAESPSADPFRYGWRWRSVRLPGGEVTEQQIPLTAEDLLDPELGDEVPQSGPHADVATTLFELLKNHFEAAPDVLTIFDMKIFWGIPGLPNPSPDLAVIRGIRDKQVIRTTFKVAEEGVLPCLIVEVVSSSDIEMRLNDHKRKVELYQRVRIPEYLIADPAFSSQDTLRLTGYRLASNGVYEPIRPDRDGCLLSETTGLRFGVAEDGRTIQVFNALTGERLLTSGEEKAGRLEAEAEIARLRAEIERLKKG